MSRIHRNSPSKGTEPAATPKPTHAPTKRVAEDIARLKRSTRATETKDEHGTTRALTTTRQGTTTQQRLERKDGPLRESSLAYEKTTSREGLERHTTFSSGTDLLGRRSTEEGTQTTRALPEGEETQRSVKTTDTWGTVKRTTEHSTDLASENAQTHRESRLARDSRGNRLTSSAETSFERQGQSVLSTNASREQGSELTTRSGATWQDKVFRLDDGADWAKTNRFERGSLRETAHDSSAVVAKADTYGAAADKVLDWLKLGPAERGSDVPADRMTDVSLHRGEQSTVDARSGVSGSQRVAFDGRGVDATFDRQATAHVSASTWGSTQGPYGEASYQAQGHAEATASVDGRARLDTNGLTATAGARAGVYVEAEARGTARTQSLSFGRAELSAEVDATVRVSAQASAEATGSVSITRRPPTAVVSGTAGASAIAKVEGEVRAAAGPFSVVGAAYASAGAEARATGILGYEDGKLKLGGSLGAALGLGAGARVTVEVDVRKIGEIAKDVVDVNDDGKVDVSDAFSAAGQVARWFGLGTVASGGAWSNPAYRFQPYVMPQWATPGVSARADDARDRDRRTPGVH